MNSRSALRVESRNVASPRVLVAARLGEGWQGLLNGALQGQAHAISAEQIIRLAELAEMARDDPRCRALLTAEEWESSSFRGALQDTDFLHSFDRYIEDYGHRGMGESVIMSPRFVLTSRSWCLRYCAGNSGQREVDRPPRSWRGRQPFGMTQSGKSRDASAGVFIDGSASRGGRLRRLCRYFALREANRHHLMYYSLAARNLLLRAGALFVERGLFDDAEDIFFIRLEEQEQLFSGIPRDWRALLRSAE